MNNNLLSQLRDIHLPKAIAWWPWAPGWYLLILISVIVLGIVIYYFNKIIKEKRYQKRVLNKIDTCYAAEINPEEKCQRLIIILRRFAIAKFNRGEIAKLHGKAWVDFLNKHYQQDIYAEGIDNILIDAAYKKTVDIDIKKLYHFVHSWIKGNF